MRELIVSKLQKNNLVAQANDLIKARYTITKNEQLLLVAMISLINPDDKEFLTFRVGSEQIAELLNLDKKSALREFEKIIDRLMGRVIKVSTSAGWRRFNWIHSAELENNVVSLKFHDDLKPYLLELKKTGNFTQLRLGMVVHFRSVYAIRIYQILKEYDSKRMNIIDFSLDDFRKIMLGDKSEFYPLFKDFRKKILNVAKRELESKDPETGLYKSDLSFDLETRRTGRKISHLKFIIRKQKTAPVKQLKIDIPPEENPHQNTPEYKAMLLLAISEKHALTFMEQYGAEYIAEKLQVLAERQQIEDVISPSGLFINALKEDRKSDKLAKQQKEQQRREKEDDKRQQEALERRKDELSSEFGKLERKAFLSSLSESEGKELITELSEPFEGNDFILKNIKKDGLSSMMLASGLIQKIPDFEGKKEAYIKQKLQK